MSNKIEKMNKVNIMERTPIEILLRIDENGMTTARNLYDFLELDKSNYSRWTRVNIAENFFAEENIDYFSFVINDERNPKPTTDYKLTAAFAKKLAMTSHTERGEQARNYFVKVEDTLKKFKEDGTTYELKQKRRKPVDVIFKQNMNMAKILSENTGVKGGIAFAIAIERTEELSGEDLTVFKKLIPSAEHETGFLNATMIGEKTGLPAKKVNVLLADKGLQYKNEKKQWRLTNEGKKYGEEFPFKRNGHSDYQIRWSNTIIEFINEKANLMCN